MIDKHQHDVLIIGAGIAGLTLALSLPRHLRVAIISKNDCEQSASYCAQGGIAAAIDECDSPTIHSADTITAGAGLCHPEIVTFTATQSRACIEWLVQQGVGFSRKNNSDADTANRLTQLHLTREGGHSQRRIIHANDTTGRAIVDTLTQQVAAIDTIDWFTDHIAVDLIISDERCQGAYVLNQQTDTVELLQARSTVLATGGASKAYLYTSNPDGASGDGIAMAWRAGCRIANMEFNQFHPTCLYHPQAKSFLISEAVRGEGGKLLLPSGEQFMQHFDPRGELAPRDIVARAIDHEIKRLGLDCVYLDISHRPAGFLAQHFPSIQAKCLALGIDMTREPIPVVPAAHYSCGGVMVDTQGRTDIDQLYAIGETSFTGLHGANRMASNSLLECVVYGRAAAASIAHTIDNIPAPQPAPAWDDTQVIHSDEDIVISHNWDELRRFMWDYVGIVRTDKRLQRAYRRITMLQQEIHEYYSHYKVSKHLLELRNLAMVAELMIRSAMQRKESRGLHYSLDYPDLLPEAKDTVLALILHKYTRKLAV